MWIFDEGSRYKNDHLPVPYRNALKEGLQAGETITVRGITIGKRFDVNLTHDAGAEKECPLHVSVRLEENAVVLNTNNAGTWGKEERKKTSLKQEQPFDIRIRCHQAKFEVFLNGEKLADYEYRKPLAEVKSVMVEGEISLACVERAGTYYSSPYQKEFHGKRLGISGMPTGQRFSINLLTGPGNFALHLNPRFDEKAIVRNSRVGGEWGPEEREGGLPMEKHRIFDIAITNEHGQYQIFVNGAPFGSFKSRFNESLTAVQVEGDVELHQVHIQ